MIDVGHALDHVAHEEPRVRQRVDLSQRLASAWIQPCWFATTLQKGRGGRHRHGDANSDKKKGWRVECCEGWR
jgi:hypothetical protein